MITTTMIQKLLRASAAPELTVDIHTDEGIRQGSVSYYDGQNMILRSGRNESMIPVADIRNIVFSSVSETISENTGRRAVLVGYLNGERVALDGVILSFDAEAETIEFIDTKISGCLTISVSDIIAAVPCEPAEKKFPVNIGASVTRMKIAGCDVELPQPPNAFENAVLCGNREKASGFLESYDRIKDCGYTEAEYDRLVKQFKICGWTNDSLYSAASRIFTLQVNKNGIAEILCRKAISLLPAYSKDISKLVNTLCTIYVSDRSERNIKMYIELFENYRPILGSSWINVKKYGEFLHISGQWEKLAAEMKYIQNAAAAAYNLNGTAAEFVRNLKDYTEYMEKFHDSNAAALLTEDRTEEDISDTEKTFIGDLPARAAYTGLMKYYEMENRYREFFILTECFYSDIIKNYEQVLRLRTVLLSYGDSSGFMEKFPVFWSDTELIGCFSKRENSRLKNILTNYPAENEFEAAIAENDTDSIKRLAADSEYLVSEGYTDDEIEHIRSVNIDEYSNNSTTFYTFRRITDLQENKDHFAERFILEGLYINPIETCGRLFPLLLTEGRYEWVTALYEYISHLDFNRSGLLKSYLTALSHTDRDKFWETAVKVYPNGLDLTLLRALYDEAVARNDSSWINTLKIRIDSSQNNPFEKSIISGNFTALKEQLEDTELLDAYNYTASEAERMKQTLQNGAYPKGKDNYNIAERLYLFQKNKNRKAESTFRNILLMEKKDSAKVPAARKLSSIYYEKGDFAELCRCFEQYLCPSIKAGTAIPETLFYITGLYRTGEYERLINFVNENSGTVDINNSTIFILYCISSLETDRKPDTEKLLQTVLNKNISADSAYSLTETILRKSADSGLHKIAGILFTKCFAQMKPEQLQNIAAAYLSRPDRASEDISDGIKAAAADAADRNELLMRWYLSIENNTGEPEKIRIISAIIRNYPECTDSFIKELIHVYKANVSEGTAKMSRTAVNEVFSLLLKYPEYRASFVDMVLDTAEYPIPDNAVSMFIKTCIEAGRQQDIMLFIERRFSSEDTLSEDNALPLFSAVSEFVESIPEGSALLPSEKEKLSSIALSCFQYIGADAEKFTDLLGICHFCGRYNDAAVICFIIREHFLWKLSDNSRISIFKTVSAEYESLSLCLANILSANDPFAVTAFASYWKKIIIDLSDSEEEQNIPADISQADDETVLKYILQNYNKSDCWKQIGEKYSSDARISENAAFLASLCKECSENYSAFASELMKLADTGSYENKRLIKLKVVSTLTKQKKASDRSVRELLSDTDIFDCTTEDERKEAVHIIGNIAAMCINKDLSSAKLAVCASEISIRADVKPAFLRAFAARINTPGDTLLTDYAAAVLLNTQDPSELDNVRDILQSSCSMLPFDRIILDIMDRLSESGELSASDTILLNIIRSNNGEHISYTHMNPFYYNWVLSGEYLDASDALDTLIRYFPNDKLFPKFKFDILSCHDLSDEKLLELYNAGYSFMQMTSFDLVKDSVRMAYQMTALEQYFKITGLNAEYPSVSAIIGNTKTDLTDMTDKIRKIMERETDSRFINYVTVVLKCAASKYWLPLFTQAEEFINCISDPYIESLTRHLARRNQYNIHSAIIYDAMNRDGDISDQKQLFMTAIWHLFSFDRDGIDYSAYIRDISGLIETKPDFVRSCCKLLEANVLLTHFAYNCPNISGMFCEDMLTVIGPSSDFIIDFMEQPGGKRIYSRSSTEFQKKLFRLKFLTGKKQKKRLPDQKTVYPDEYLSISDRSVCTELALERLNYTLKNYGFAECTKDSVYDVTDTDRFKSPNIQGLGFPQKIIILKAYVTLIILNYTTGDEENRLPITVGCRAMINSVILIDSNYFYSDRLFQFLRCFPLFYSEITYCVLLSRRKCYEEADSYISSMLDKYKGDPDKERRCGIVSAVNRFMEMKNPRSDGKQLPATAKHIPSPLIITDHYVNENISPDKVLKYIRSEEQKNTPVSLTPVQYNGSAASDTEPDEKPDLLSISFIKSAMESSSAEEPDSSENTGLAIVRDRMVSALLRDPSSEDTFRICFDYGMSLLRNSFSHQLFTDTMRIICCTSPAYSDNIINELTFYAALREYFRSFEHIDTLCDDMSEKGTLILKAAQLITASDNPRSEKNKLFLQEIRQHIDAASCISDINTFRQHSYLFKNEIRKDVTSDTQDIFNKINLLYSDKLIRLSKVPDLYIKIDSTDLTWGTSDKSGSATGYIMNIGGDQALNVKFTVNLTTDSKNTSKTEYFIDRIYPNEKIPFSLTVTEKMDISLYFDAVIVVNYTGETKENYSKYSETRINIIRDNNTFNEYGTFSEYCSVSGEAFVGRENELEKLSKLIAEGEQHTSVTVYGLKRAGKTSLIKHFIETRLTAAKDTDESSRPLVIQIDGQTYFGAPEKVFIKKTVTEVRNILRREGTPFPDNLVSRWSKAMEAPDWYIMLDELYHELYEISGHRKLILVLDEMESIFFSTKFRSEMEQEALFSVLRSLIQSSENIISFIFIGSDRLLTSCFEEKRESQLFQLMYRLEVGRLNYRDINSIFSHHKKKYGLVFTTEAIDEIWKFTDGLIWYVKLIASIITERILTDEEGSKRKRVYINDVHKAVRLLLEGAVGKDKYNLIDASLNPGEKTIIRVMAELMPDRNIPVSTARIRSKLETLISEGYTMEDSDLQLSNLSSSELSRNLAFLEKMQFIRKDDNDNYLFVAELYRLFMRKNKRLHSLEKIRNK